MSKEKVKRINFGAQTMPTQAVFLAIYAPSTMPYLEVFDGKIAHLRIPLMLMVLREDLRLGFPGGTFEQGEDILEVLRRELKEEIFFTSSFNPIEVCSHEIPGRKLNTHLFAHETNYRVIKKISGNSIFAEHAIVETAGTAIIKVQDDSFEGRKFGLSTLFQSELPPSAREELAILLSDHIIPAHRFGAHKFATINQEILKNLIRRAGYDFSILVA